MSVSKKSVNDDSLRLTVQIATVERSLSFESLIKKTVKYFSLELVECSESVVVRVVDLEESRDVNLCFRGIDQATNVLAFTSGDSKFSLPNHLGDLVVCGPLVLLEAAKYQIPPCSRLCHLVTHGLLHLVGFDHDTEENSKVMEAIEINILNQIGIDNPYNE